MAIGEVPSERNALVRRFLKRTDEQTQRPEASSPAEAAGTDELEQWLAAAPTLWHTYSAEELSALTF